MSTHIQPKKSQKRKRGKQPMVDGEPDSAQVVTHKQITVISDDGTMVKKKVLESLDTPAPSAAAEPKAPEIPPTDHEMDNMSPQPEPIKIYRVGIFVTGMNNQR
jgi:hypothetical protein